MRTTNVVLCVLSEKRSELVKISFQICAHTGTDWLDDEGVKASFPSLLADTGLFFTPNPYSSFFKPLEQLIFQYLSLEPPIHHG